MKPDPFAPFVVYRSPDYVEPEQALPLYIHDWHELRDHCRSALARRRKTYPAWIPAGRITQTEADADLSAWEALLAQWIWIIDGPDCEGAILPDLLSLHARIQAVDLASQRVDQEIHGGNRTHDMMLQSHLNQALRWHLERERRGERTAAFYASLNREIAEDRAARGLPPSAVRMIGPDSSDVGKGSW